MKIIIASDQERENLFAEIHLDGGISAEVILGEHSGRFELTIFPPEGKRFVIGLTEFQRALEDARQALEIREYYEAS